MGRFVAGDTFEEPYILLYRTEALAYLAIGEETNHFDGIAFAVGVLLRQIIQDIDPRMVPADSIKEVAAAPLALDG